MIRVYTSDLKEAVEAVAAKVNDAAFDALQLETIARVQAVISAAQATQALAEARLAVGRGNAAKDEKCAAALREKARLEAAVPAVPSRGVPVLTFALEDEQVELRVPRGVAPKHQFAARLVLPASDLGDDPKPYVVTGLNIRYLQDALRFVQAEMVEVKFADEYAPFEIYESPTTFDVIMPTRL